LKKEEKRPAMLVNILGEIVERCAGSPLAAIALGPYCVTKPVKKNGKLYQGEATFAPWSLESYQYSSSVIMNFRRI
jgi:hypothetical protein